MVELMKEANELHYEAACELLKKDRTLSIYMLKKSVQEQFPNEVINSSSLNLAKDWIEQMRIYINSTEDFLKLLKVYCTNKEQEEFVFNSITLTNKFVLDTLLLSQEFAPTINLSAQVLWFKTEAKKYRFYLKKHGNHSTTILKGTYLNYSQAQASKKFKESDFKYVINKCTYEICVQ